MKSELEFDAREAFVAGLSWERLYRHAPRRIVVLPASARERLLSIVVTGELPPLLLDELGPPAAIVEHDTRTAARFGAMNSLFVEHIGADCRSRYPNPFSRRADNGQASIDRRRLRSG